MKKWIIFMAVFAMLISILPVAFAVEADLTISDASGKPGDIVYLVVSLHEETIGDTLGITFTYDSAVLKPVAEMCSWAKKGILSDFDTNDRGVWAANKKQDLSGDVCALAFQVLEGTNFTQTEVGCTLLVKLGANTVANYEAVGRISLSCDHSYSDWNTDGITGHTRVCGICGEKQMQGHSWNEGFLSDDPEHEDAYLFTRICTVCGETNKQSVSSDVKDDMNFGTVATETTLPGETGVTAPSVPQETFPKHTEPLYKPKEPTLIEEATEATEPSPNWQDNQQSGNHEGNPYEPTGTHHGSGSQQNDESADGNDSQRPGNQNSSSLYPDGNVLQGSSQERHENPEMTEPPVREQGIKQDEHSHSHDEDGNDLLQEDAAQGSDEETECTDPSHNHTHDHASTATNGRNGTSVAVVIVATIIMGIAVYVYLRKKRIFRKNK